MCGAESFLVDDLSLLLRKQQIWAPHLQAEHLKTWLEASHYWQITIDEVYMYLKPCLTYLSCILVTLDFVIVLLVAQSILSQIV